MRTNIELDDELMAEAGKYSTAGSKQAVVQEALAKFITVKREERRRATYAERLKKIRTQATQVRLRVDTRDLLREDRDSR